LKVAYDNVFERPGLNLKTKELLAIAHLLNVGSESELKTHIHGALNCGTIADEIKETILHAAMAFQKLLLA
jgi:4-carboxymuconolactone decarboxylase